MEKNSREEKKLRFLGIFGIIRAAIEIPFINPSFIAFTFITSLPLFCVMILPKLPFEPTRIREALYQLEQLNFHSNILISVASWLLYGTIRVGLVHLSDLITFLATVTAIDSASTIYKGGAGRSMGLRDLLRNSITRKRWQNSMFAYTVMSWLSSVSFDAVILYGEVGPLCSLRNEWSPPLHFFTQVAASFVRDEYSAWWQLALVVSVLEEDQLLFDAFLTSSKLRKGNSFRGFVLMLVYFGWRCLPSLLGLQRSGVAYAFIDRGLFCLGKVMNWVACTVYYHDCKNRQRREEVAKED